MTENMRLWDKLGRTDPANTKGFKRAGGFAGTAIKPMWSFKRMTEEFGPCGLGWGVNEPSFQVVPGHEGEVLVYCTVSIWYGEGQGEDERNCVHSPVFGVGGDKVVGKNKYGLTSDDEAFKKAYTDAIGNALKLIGVGADVHMGLFDDSKYVQEMRQEFADDQQPDVVPERAPSVRTVAAEKAKYAELKAEMNKESANGVAALKRWVNDPSVLADINSLERYSEDFKTEFRETLDIMVTAERDAGSKATPSVEPNFENLEH